MMQRLHICLLVALLAVAACDNIPIRVRRGLFTEPYPHWVVQVDTLFIAQDSTDHYCNGAVPVVWKGKIYCMWQSSATHEDSEDTHVVYTEGVGPARDLASLHNTACSSGGWIAREDSLIALVNIWTDPPRVQYTASADGKSWTRLRPVLMADGTPMKAVMEQDSYLLPSGLRVGAAHFPPGLKVCPIYTDSKTGTDGWKKAAFHCEDVGEQSRALEPSLYLRKDGRMVMLFRDQASSYKKLVSISRDNGMNWSTVSETDIPDSRSKQCAGNLADGQAFVVGNLFPRKDRSALHIALSANGIEFDQVYELLQAQDLPPQRFPGRAKTIGYSYPKACLQQDTLLIACSLNKEAILLLHVVL